jgi:hypothetical protein
MPIFRPLLSLLLLFHTVKENGKIATNSSPTTRYPQVSSMRASQTGLRCGYSAEGLLGIFVTAYPVCASITSETVVAFV